MSTYFALNKTCYVLSKQINLRDHRVRVADCSIPQTLLLQYSPLSIMIYEIDDDYFKYRSTVNVTLPYSSNFHLLGALNEALKGVGNANMNDSAGIHIVVKQDLRLIFSRTLATLLGLKGQVVEGASSAEHPTSTQLLASRVIVLGNFVEPFYCNGAYLPCIYQGPLMHHVNSADYHKALDMTFGWLNIRILNFAQEEILLPDGLFSILLQFEIFF